MKLIYANVVSESFPSVTQKIETISLFLKQYAGDFQSLAFYCSESNYAGRESDTVEYIAIPEFAKYTGHFAIPNYLSKTIKHRNPDVVILRIIAQTPVFWYFFRNRNYKLITEHHTKIVPELMLHRYYTQAISSWISRPLLNGITDGKICVTNEISQYEAYSKHNCVIANGFDYCSNFTSFQPFDGKNIRFAMACSKNMPWHGIDRLFRSIREWQQRSEFEISIDMIGNVKKDEFSNDVIPQNVVFHGMKNQKELSLILKNANIGVSALALHRIHMKEACSLKSRDYIARGLPFIYGYDDPDILCQDEFCMKVPNDESLIQFEAVLEFLHEITKKKSMIEKKMQVVAQNRISWNIKAKQYVEFAEKIYTT